MNRLLLAPKRIPTLLIFFPRSARRSAEKAGMPELGVSDILYVSHDITKYNSRTWTPKYHKCEKIKE